MASVETTTAATAPAPVPAAATPAAAAPVVAAPTKAPHPSASLYVGDILPDVTETRLFEIFNPVGPVASIRVCRDSITRRSLGYAYVNFVNVVDAERALDTLNNCLIRGKQCRIMWSQRDPTIRKSGVGNIFIKNLDPAIDHKQLFDAFSQYGNILSCKVAADENGTSKSYGFVHFETQEAAELSIAKVNNTLLGTLKVYVGKFIPKKEWLKQKENSWTNIFCKNLPPTFTDERLVTLFSEFGGITSAVVSKTAAGQDSAPSKEVEPAKPAEEAKPAAEGETAEGDAAKPEGDAKPEEAAAPKEPKEKTLFGFVNFKNHLDAVRAVQALHGRTLDAKYDLYCSRAQKKNERANELKKKFEQLKLERMTKYQGINLYIKNLEDDVDEERLRKEFSPFGKVKTVKIEPGRGFGFLCFTTPEEANRALTEMNGRILPGCQKPLYVNLFEPREVRKQKLAAQYAARMKARPAPNAGNVAPPAGMGYPGPQGMYPYPQPQGYFPGPFRGPGPRWAGPPQGGQGQQFAGQPGQIAGRAHQQPGGPQPQGQPRPQGGQPQGQPRPQANGAPNQNAGQRRIQSRGPAGAPAQAPQPGAPATAPTEPQLLSVTQIQAFPAAQQRMLIGERLYYKIQQKDPIRAGKITGMFLDLAQNNLDELYRLLESDEALFQKVDEAVRVLEEAAKKQQQQTPTPAPEDK